LRRFQTTELFAPRGLALLAGGLVFIVIVIVITLPPWNDAKEFSPRELRMTVAKKQGVPSSSVGTDPLTTKAMPAVSLLIFPHSADTHRCDRFPRPLFLMWHCRVT